MTREYRIVETGETTRDELTADDAHYHGRTVHYRDHGPHDETPSARGGTTGPRSSPAPPGYPAPSLTGEVPEPAPYDIKVIGEALRRQQMGSGQKPITRSPKRVRTTAA